MHTNGSSGLALRPISLDDLKHDSAQILLKIVSGDEQKRDLPQILLKIVKAGKGRVKTAPSLPPVMLD